MESICRAIRPPRVDGKSETAEAIAAARDELRARLGT